MKINFDCKNLVERIPCKFHKEFGSKCNNCKYYAPIEQNILIIKVGAMGDVLRTTCLLPALKRKYPNSQITWIVDKKSTELLAHNPLVDRLLYPDDSQTLLFLQAEEFDFVLSLDVERVSCALANITNGKEKLGFGLTRYGSTAPISKEAEEWFRMSVDDEIKKRNKATYQSHMFNICRLEYHNEEPIFILQREAIAYQEEFVQAHALDETHPVIGLHTGAGRRWEFKKWNVDGFIQLVKLLKNEFGEKTSILLLGGNSEQERNRLIFEKTCGGVIVTNTDESASHLAALIALCNVLVCGDTLPLHLATALKVPVVALFGPTSPQEIELYGRGRKIVPDIKCICCYRSTCNHNPNCMEMITPDLVLREILAIVK